MAATGESGLDTLMTDFGSGRMSRRELITRAGALGVSAAAVAAMASAPGNASAAGSRPRALPTGGTLRVAGRGNGQNDTLNTAKIADPLDGIRTRAIFDQLYFSDDSYVPQPWLAEETESSPDAKVWTIRLVEGATFHDGAPVTAEDVKFTIERLRDPAVGARYADVLTFMEGSELTVMDERTLRVTLQQGYGDFQSVFADPGPNILPKTFDESKAETAPIGSGPFKFESFTPGSESRFVRNENYWKPGYPFADELVVLNIADESARNNALLGGQVDLIVNVGYSSAVPLGAAGATIIEIPGTTILPIVCVMDAEPFTSTELRQALAYAIDRPTAVEIVYKGYGRVGNDHPISDSYPYHPVGIPQRERDIDRARELLTAAGYPDGIDLTLITGDASPGMLDLATVVAEQVAEAGIRITLQRHPTDTFWDEVWLKENFYTSAWTQKSTPDLFLGRTATTGASWNEIHLADPEVDRLLAEARANADPDARTQLYTAAMQRVHDTAAWIIVGYGSLLHASSQAFQWETLPPPLSAPHLFNASVG